MDLAEIRRRAQQRFRDTGGLIVGTTTWNQHINQAMREFLRAGRWPFTSAAETFSVTANQRLVDLDAALTADAATVISSMENLYNVTDDRVCQPLPYQPLAPQMAWRFRLFIEGQDPGESVLYEVIGKDLYLIPPPRVDTEFRIYWFQDPDDLTADTDVPVIPVRYQEALVTGAVAKAHLDDQNTPAAQQYQAEFQAIVSQATAELVLGETEEVKAMGDGNVQPMANLGLTADQR